MHFINDPANHQVWYQNSRARERKGQFRQNMQIINKKCPYCSAIFKVKSALESHMQTKHTDKPMINIELIPDVKFCTESNEPSNPSFHPGSDLKMSQLDGTFSNIHGLDLSQHLLQLASNLHHSDADFNRCESIISFSDSNFEHDDDEDDVRSVIDDDEEEEDNNSNDTTTKKEHPADNDQFYISSPSSSTQSQPVEVNPQTLSVMSQITAQTSTCSSTDTKKRSRTSVSRLQVNILRQVFKDVKNPTMKNCFSIGKEIGLTKRVIQVTTLELQNVCLL